MHHFQMIHRNLKSSVCRWRRIQTPTLKIHPPWWGSGDGIKELAELQILFKPVFISEDCVLGSNCGHCVCVCVCPLSVWVFSIHTTLSTNTHTFHCWSSAGGWTCVCVCVSYVSYFALLCSSLPPIEHRSHCSLHYIYILQLHSWKK